MAIRVRLTQGKRTEKSLLGRRLNTIDAVILVAAIAVGIAVGRTYYLRSMEVHLTRNSSKLALVAHGNAGVWVADVVGSASPFLLSATLAILILRLRRLCPGLRVAFRQPGNIAFAVVMLVFVVYLVVILSYYALLYATSRLVLREDFDLSDWGAVSWVEEFDETAEKAGEAVAAVWLTLALVGACRYDGDWIDRLGCLFAFCWILYSFSDPLSQVVANYLFYTN